MNRLIEKVNKFKHLDPGWDGYADSMPPSNEVIDSVCTFLDHMTAVPGADGSIQLECHACDVDFELEFDSNGRVESLLIDDAGLYDNGMSKTLEFNNADIDIIIDDENNVVGLSLEYREKK